MTQNDTETCPVCGEEYNHVIKNGYRNGWPTEGGEVASVKFEVCTPADSDYMYVHTEGVTQMACGDMLATAQERFPSPGDLSEDEREELLDALHYQVVGRSGCYMAQNRGGE